MKVATLLIVLHSFPAWAQSDDTGSNATLLEESLAMDENNTEDGASYENMAQFLAHPLNLNSATAEDLRQLSTLTVKLVSNIIDHRTINGNFLSIYELQSVEGLDTETIRSIMPYVAVRPPSEVVDRSIVRRIALEGESYFLFLTTIPFEQKRGFRDETYDYQRFRGSPGKMLMRYRNARPGDFSVGVTAEKDEGEKFQFNNKEKIYGFDFLSWHVQLSNKGRLKNLVVGDFQCQFGQGLVWGGVMGFGKGAETITSVRRSNIGLVPYTSAYEAGYYRGIGSSVQLRRNLLLTGLISHAFRDGYVRHDESEATLSSMQTTGLHRNAGEYANRKTLTERTIGSVLQYRSGNFEVGVTTQWMHYNAVFVRRPQPYNQFAFGGSSNLNASAFANFNINNASFFGEFARSSSGGTALVGGVLVSLSRKLESALLYRNYSREFHGFYNNGFAESSLAQNERGLYWGWKYRFSRRYTFSGYFDLFEFPWLKFRTYSPTRGSEIFARASWQPSRTTTVFLQGRLERKPRNRPDETQTYKPADVQKINYCLSVDFLAHRQLRMRTRIQGSHQTFNGMTTRGFLTSHDITLTLSGLKISARYALFDTDDYDNRQYAYENDVWMAYSLPAFYDQGVRKYLLVQYKFNRSLTMWLRYGHIRYTNRETIGSGADTTDGNQRNEIKFETRIRF